MRKHVADSSAFQSLRSRFGGGSSRKEEKQAEELPPLAQGTIGSPRPKKKIRALYSELMETNGTVGSKFTVDSGTGTGKEGEEVEMKERDDSREERREEPREERGVVDEEQGLK